MGSFLMRILGESIFLGKEAVRCPEVSEDSSKIYWLGYFPASGADTPATASRATVNDDLAESLYHVSEDEVGVHSESDETSAHSVDEITSPSEPGTAKNTLLVPCYTLAGIIRNKDFCGHQDVLLLIDNTFLHELDETTHGQLTQHEFALCGLGGIGKTEIAKEFCFTHQHRFDAIFWVEADRLTQLSEGFASIAAQIGHTDRSNKVVSRNIALEWLKHPMKRQRNSDASTTSGTTPVESQMANWLLVFNNADNLELLKKFWPVTTRGSFLITSRDPVAMRGRPGVDIKPFEPNEAVTVLRHLTVAPDKELATGKQASIKISTRLGGLPLAITQVAALIDRWEMTLDEFLGFLQKQASIETIARERPPVLQEQYPHSLFTVWALDSLTKSALTLLQAMSFLSPDSIGEFIFLKYAPEVTEVPMGFPMTQPSYIQARTELTRVSLVRRNKMEGELSLHRLVQDVVRVQMSEQRSLDIINFVTQSTFQAWPTPFLRFDHDTATWKRSEELLPHILKLSSFIPEYSHIIGSSQLKHTMAKLLVFAGCDFEAARPHFLEVLRLSSDLAAEMEETRADAYFALSALSAQVNEHPKINLDYAQHHFDCRLKLCDRAQFREDRMAMAYGELAHAQRLAGLYEVAIENTRVAIELTEASPAFKSGDNWPTFSNTHQAFALAALGRYGEAITPIHRSLEYWSKRASTTHSFQ
ncbi:uncharacterized protein E0L32_009425 [Thyridium curvatum]|uniref:DUF7779 domain-containing protein n=1 Tax=Thyridium curvatum TaxID=1093900 RepID=A0A507AWT4_9PEZI|nr:uncharacterized protein E0L32_009425 [Thyridium curvatum]TPX09381.1 hypothetical protein E0L32_009425 [Thyridium curvatum]